MYVLPADSVVILSIKAISEKLSACLANEELVFENHELFCFSMIPRPRLHSEEVWVIGFLLF